MLAQNDVKNNNITVLSKNLDAAKAEVDQLSTKIQSLKSGTKEYADAAAQLNEAQNNVIKKRKELYDVLGKPLANIPASANTGDGETVTVEELKNQLASVNSQIADIDLIKNKTAQQISELKNLRKQKQDLLKEIREERGTTSTTQKASALTAQDRDDFSIIESNTKREVSLEETRVTEIKKTRQLTFEEEVQYVNNTEAINVKYINQKIGILESEKNLNAKEKETLAAFYKERSDIELRSVQDIQVIRNKEFTQRQTTLRNQLDEEIAVIKEKDNIIQENPLSTNREKAQSKLNADNEILALYERFNNEVEKSEKELGVNSVKNFKEIINQVNILKKDVLKDQINISLSGLKDV